MLYHRLAAAGALLVTALVSVLVIVGLTRRADSTRFAEHKSVGFHIELVRENPPDTPSGDVECKSFAFVDSSYKIFNRGEAALSGLKLGTKCACEQA